VRIPTSNLDSSGFSLLEALVASLLVGIAVIGISTYVLTASGQHRSSRIDMDVWEAAGAQMEILLALGYNGLSSGSATVQGFPMSWQVTGADPKKLVLLISVPQLNGSVEPDTIVTYVSDQL